MDFGKQTPKRSSFQLFTDDFETTLTKQKHGHRFEGKESDFAVYILC